MFLEGPPLSKETLYEYVAASPEGVTLCCIQEHFLDRGDKSLSLPGNKVVWMGMSIHLVEMLIELLQEQKIDAYTCDPLLYWSHHRGVPFPIAKRVKHNYTKPHWLPTVLIARLEDDKEQRPGDAVRQTESE